MGSFLQEVKGFTPVIDVVAAEVGFVTAGVYGVAWRYCQMEDGVCKASLERIAGHLNVDPKTAQRHLKKLCETSYLKDTTPGARNKPHVYVDTGKVIITGLVEARLSPRQKVLPPAARTESPAARTESPAHQDRESVEDSIKDSIHDTLPAPKSAQVTEPGAEESAYSPEDEPILVPVEDEEDDGSPRTRKKLEIPETKFQRDFLAVCGAKRFKPRQKTKVKKLTQCLDIGTGFHHEADCYQRCLKELEGCTDFPDRPLAIPLSWYEWRAKHASEHRWSVTGFINALFDRDALVRHCQVKLKKLGIVGESKERRPPSGPEYY